MFTKAVLALALLSGASAYVAPPARPAARSAVVTQETVADLQALATAQKVPMGFYDPIGLSDNEFWGESNEATIGWIREAEIKHGRVAMMAFVGYCVQANGIRWPWADNHLPNGVSPFPAASLSPPEQWDALPPAAKWQIVLFAFIMELWGEGARDQHYMRGGKPGVFPAFDGSSDIALPHPVPLNLFDPFGLSKKASAEKKARGLNVEINNGRLAMIGVVGFMSESKVPGSVPALTGKISAYAGDYMAPFATDFGMVKHDIVDPFM